MRQLFGQLARFGVVGLGGFVIDVAVFNLLRLTVLAPEHVAEGPLIAKAISTSLAILFNWLGNRYWTFRATRRRQALREAVEFILVSVAGSLISMLCLWISHYVLGLTSPVADNISSNVIGLALGTAFRFVFYRWWVFHPDRKGAGRGDGGGRARERARDDPRPLPSSDADLPAPRAPRP